jgi:hypothetical protein
MASGFTGTNTYGVVLTSMGASNTGNTALVRILDSRTFEIIGGKANEILTYVAIGK